MTKIWQCLVALITGVLLVGYAVAGAAASAGSEQGELGTDRRLTSVASQTDRLVYVGTYTDGKSKGIYVYRFNTVSGTLQLQSIASDKQNPAYLSIHPNQRYLYAVNEIGRFEGRASGAISAFAIDETTGNLERLNQRSTIGTGPCHLSVDPKGRYVLVANYGGGSVALLPIGADGSLEEATSFIQHQGRGSTQRQRGPHAHSIICDPEGQLAFAADLGLDKILVYELDAEQGKLRPHTTPWAQMKAGAGPRHTTFSTDGRFFYTINELDSTITAFSYAAEAGILTEIQTISTLPTGFVGTSYCADIHLHPSGKFLYGSNRGHDSIVIYRVDEASGQLTLVGHTPTQGRTPRSFVIDPDGDFLLVANQDSDSIVIFQIDRQTGTLRATGQSTSVPKPVCLKFL